MFKYKILSEAMKISFNNIFNSISYFMSSKYNTILCIYIYILFSKDDIITELISLMIDEAYSPCEWKRIMAANLFMKIKTRKIIGFGLNTSLWCEPWVFNTNSHPAALSILISLDTQLFADFFIKQDTNE